MVGEIRGTEVSALTYMEVEDALQGDDEDSSDDVARDSVEYKRFSTGSTNLSPVRRSIKLADLMDSPTEKRTRRERRQKPHWNIGQWQLGDGSWKERFEEVASRSRAKGTQSDITTSDVDSEDKDGQRQDDEQIVDIDVPSHEVFFSASDSPGSIISENSQRKEDAVPTAKDMEESGDKDTRSEEAQHPPPKSSTFASIVQRRMSSGQFSTVKTVMHTKSALEEVLADARKHKGRLYFSVSSPKKVFLLSKHQHRQSPLKNHRAKVLFVLEVLTLVRLAVRKVAAVMAMVMTVILPIQIFLVTMSAPKAGA